MTTSINCAGYPLMTINGQTWIGTSPGNQPAAAIPTFSPAFIFSAFAGGWGLANNSTGGFIITRSTLSNVTIENNNNYIGDTNFSFLTPASPSLGDTYMFTSMGSATIQFVGSQAAHFGGLVTSAGGTIRFLDQDGGLTMVCVQAGGSGSQFVCFDLQGRPYVS
jgi:hypothetical protein